MYEQRAEKRASSKIEWLVRETGHSPSDNVIAH
jgi:hypothetical protein